MDKLNKSIGPEFRRMRQLQDLTIREVSDGIISPTNLSRWERGEQDLSVSLYYKLLDRIHVSAEEIKPQSRELFDFITEIGILHMNNKVSELQEKSKKLLLKYSKDKNEHNLLKAAIACNYYLDLTQIDLTDEIFKSMLTLQVCKIKNWYKSDLIFFANTQFLLKPTIIYDLADSLVSDVFEMDIVPNMQVDTLLNAIFALIKKKAILCAKGILHKIKNLTFSPNNYSAEYKIIFFNILLHYIDTSNSDEVYEFLSSLPHTKSGDQLREDSKYSFLQIKDIYKKK